MTLTSFHNSYAATPWYKSIFKPLQAGFPAFLHIFIKRVSLGLLHISIIFAIRKFFYKSLAASSDEIMATSESMLGQANNISKNSGQVETSAEELAASAEQLSNQVQQFHI